MNEVEIMLRRLGDIKINDAQVLLKLYNMYRFRVQDHDDSSFAD